MKRYFVYGDDCTESEHGEWVKWDEANARVAELETWYARAMKDVSELNQREHAALARAEAAREMSITARMLLKGGSEMRVLLATASARAEAAETEVTALRAELDAVLGEIQMARDMEDE